MKIQLASEKIYYIEETNEEDKKEPNKNKKCQCKNKKNYISSCNHYLCEKCFNSKNVKFHHICDVCSKEFMDFFEFFEIEFYDGK